MDPNRPGAPRPHILIIGGGIVGLTLAQALLKYHPSTQVTVYERDPDASWRGAGWGLTIHWALSTFLDLMPQKLIDRFEEIFVDPVASREGDGNFLFLDLRSGQQRWRVPPNRRIRVRRECLRRLLMEHVDIKWSKSITSISTDANSVTAHFADSTSATGTLLVGCDGTRSRVRQILCPNRYQNTRLPVRLLGTSVTYPAKKVARIRALDPFFMQGADPETDVFLYFSFLNTPSSHAGKRNEYTCQVLLSWPYRPGFLGEPEPIDVPPTNDERIALMKRFAVGWTEPFRSIVLDLPPDAQAKVISLEDWPLPASSSSQEPVWDNMKGRATLAGDAAHAMVMYRGEAANHGITDVSTLLSHLGPYLSSFSTPSSLFTSLSPSAITTETLETVITAYETEMITRTRPAVLASRRACLDAHDYKRINESSPLVSKRAIDLPDEPLKPGR